MSLPKSNLASSKLAEYPDHHLIVGPSHGGEDGKHPGGTVAVSAETATGAAEHRPRSPMCSHGSVGIHAPRGDMGIELS